MNYNWSYRTETLKSGSNCGILYLCDFEIGSMTPKYNRVYLFNFSESFVHNNIAICEFKSGVFVRKRWNRGQIGDILARVAFKSCGWHWKTIGHLFHATSSSVYHFVAICEFKLELRNWAKFVLTSVNLTVDLWSWTFVWTSLLSMLFTAENFMMIWWQEHFERSVTGGQTGGRPGQFIELLRWR